ncbi:hypothetical protein HDV00_009545 [Rhizophlyctis rosea]|nr:hypothetical protein HDV00_009545 [Rhizophlyctis rosea]
MTANATDNAEESILETELESLSANAVYDLKYDPPDHAVQAEKWQNSPTSQPTDANMQEILEGLQEIDENIGKFTNTMDCQDARYRRQQVSKVARIQWNLLIPSHVVSRKSTVFRNIEFKMYHPGENRDAFSKVAEWFSALDGWKAATGLTDKPVALEVEVFVFGQNGKNGYDMNPKSHQQFTRERTDMIEDPNPGPASTTNGPDTETSSNDSAMAVKRNPINTLLIAGISASELTYDATNQQRISNLLCKFGQLERLIIFAITRFQMRFNDVRVMLLGLTKKEEKALHEALDVHKDIFRCLNVLWRKRYFTWLVEE